MNIETLTSSKNYNNHHLNVCPSDDAGLMRYSSSPPTSRYHGQPVKSPSSPMNHQNSYTSSPSYSTSSSKEGSDLQSVVSKYQANPELLKLILASKVEEDKRRTEEAKLRAKELDLYFQQQQQQQQQVVRKPEPTPANRNSLLFEKSQQDQTVRRRSSCSSTSSNGSTINSTGANEFSTYHHHRRIAPYSIPRPIAINNSTAPRRNSSASSALLSINRLSINNNTTMQSQQEANLASSAPSSTSQYLYQSPSNNARTIISPDNKPPKTSRRRRSMQAISKIVETVDNPYEDGHFWKNNGNTIQKKTGCKSVYYKCANSCKGCPVNKTVIEQPDHSFVIKYRGEHVSECFQVEHIRDL